MNKNTKSTLFSFGNVEVVWANLAKPDEFRGTTKHDISYIISEEQLAEAAAALPAGAEIKGVRVGDKGDTIAKAKTTVFTKQGKQRFEKIYDAEPKLVNVIIGRGDTVNVNVSLYNYDANLYTILLNGVQLIEKNPEFASSGSSNGTGFGAVDGGFTGDATTAQSDAPASQGADSAESPSLLSGDAEEMPF